MRDHRAKKTPEQDKILANALAEGMPVGKALIKAGYTQRQSLKGWDSVPKRVVKLLPKKAERLINLADMTPPEVQRKLTIGRLVDNVTKGSDKAVQSAKALGSTRDNNLFTPDMQMGVIVLTCPQGVMNRKAELLAEDKE